MSKGSLRLPLRLSCCEGESLRMRLGLLLFFLMLLCDAILCGFSAWATPAMWGCVNEGFCDWIVWRGRWWGFDGVSQDVVKIIQ